MGKKEKAAAAALAAVAAAGLVTGAVIDRPADLLADTPFAAELQEDDAESAEAEQKKSGIAARIRMWLLSLPAPVRMLVGIPLWCLGWILLTGLSAFWAGAMTPLASRILGWLCLCLILIAVYTLTVKSAFPDIPLRKLVRVRDIIVLLIISLVLAAADLALPTVWEGYDVLHQIIWRGGATCLLAFSCYAALRRQGKRVRKQQAAAAKRTTVEEEAWRLAETVCPPRG